MAKTKTTRYDVAEHLRTPEEMAAYLEAVEADDDGGERGEAKQVLAQGTGHRHSSPSRSAMITSSRP